MKILFGIQPTSEKIHIGNYLGGLKQAIEMQKDHDVTFLVADYHALTTIDPITALRNYKKIKEVLKKLGAKKIVCQQKEVARMAWYIMCLTPVTELQKMTQWKDKGKGNAGLLTYPCLMAADIFMSGCDAVIVGEDQVQHIEFYRNAMRKAGEKKIAEIIVTETPRIMSIKDPTKKMSKSLGEEHCLFLFEDNARKIMKAPTTEDGIKNLLQIADGLGVEFSSNFKESKEKLIEKINSIKL